MTGSPHLETVACLGSSTTASRGTYKWIDELERRPHNSRFRFVNLGVGGDLSANAVRRLDRVIAQRPDRVIVLIGSNDIMASVFPHFRRFVRVTKRLRDEPTPERFDENLAVIVRRLQREADARIALSSLAPVGEEPGSRHPVQARLNDLFSTYNGIIRKAAAHPRRHRDKALGEGPALVKQRLTCDEQTQNRTARAVRVRFCVCSPG